MSAGEQQPSDRIAQLRKAVLTGRGPGALEQEIADHTRNRPMLGAVPALIERAVVARQTVKLRAGEPITLPPTRSQIRTSRRRAAFVGATAALLARSIAMRLLRPRRPPDP